jgi:hypothetical protein
MWANTVIHHVVRVLGIPLFVVTIITTFTSGILLGIPIVGLVFLLATSLLWLPFLAVLLV